ncbi:hypothetical protein Ahy_A09g042705 [Arachis hypogaea]|uniref:GRF-type domain-containing protein n=1 Tax=Arachis hypogaea TaxID=3818 RepID=A0A445BGQ2_ARAHY|nr:hypothetical protein Ahy_A09g042705 [Arachis hypogaea]
MVVDNIIVLLFECSEGRRSSKVQQHCVHSVPEFNIFAICSPAHSKELLCGHGERPVLRTSTTKENLGQKFWGCIYYEVQDGCDFFRWADPKSEEA